MLPPLLPWDRKRWHDRHEDLTLSHTHTGASKNMHMCPAQTDYHNDAARLVTARKAVGSGCEHVLFMTIHGPPVHPAHLSSLYHGMPPLLHPPSVPSNLADRCLAPDHQQAVLYLPNLLTHAALHHSRFDTVVAVTISLTRNLPFSFPLPVLGLNKLFEVKPHVPCYKIRIECR